MSTSEKGRRGEELAATYLESCGYEILERNFWFCGGEIDLVARQGETVVFAEVKHWDVYGIDEMRRTVNWKKKRRIIRASMGYLNAHRRFDDYRVRYDLIFLSSGGKIVEHIEDAFTETDAL